MSKNMIRKSLAFGAFVAMVSSGLAAPAVADTTGPVTLVPNAGTTFNSILQSGITLQTELDPNDVSAAEAATLTYKITNAGAASITATFTGSYKVGGVAGGAVGTYAKQTMHAVDTNITASGNTLAAFTDRIDSTVATHAAAAATSKKYVWISGAVNDTADDDNIANDLVGSLNIGSTLGANTLSIATSVTTKNVTLVVQAFLDQDGDGYMDTFEKKSDAETIILYAAANVSATTTIDYLKADDSSYRTAIVYNNSINPFQVAARTYGKLFVGGTLVDVTDDEADVADDDADDFTVAAISASTTANGGGDTIGLTKNTLAVGVTSVGVSNAFNMNADNDNVVDMVLGTYTAQTYYFDGTSYLPIGAASAAFDLNAGVNTAVDTLEPTVTETANLDFAAGNNTTSTLGVRTGTKSFVVNVQARDANGGAGGGVLDLQKSAIKVRATVTAATLDSGAVSVTGSSASLAEDDVTVGYAFTNSKGIASFTITNTGATEDDVVTAKFEVLLSDGTWADPDTLTATWADGALASWSAVGGNYVSGDPVNITFKAIDQFGAPISTDDDAALAVVAVASVGGLSKPATYSKTVSVVDGVASFSFANYATAGGSAQLVATLKAGTSNATPTSGSAAITVNVYNTNATNSITVADSFSTAINYADYVTGALTDPAVVAAATASGIASAASVDITGNVLDVNGVGQPGAAVTLKATGVLFKDASNYAVDEITTYANEYGAFTVTARTHTVVAAGATVTITSGAVSTSTLLKSYFPNAINDENLAFSWSFPAEVVKNTTYAVTAKLTDKWGNPIAAKDAQGNADATDFAIQFQGTGSVEVNGVGTAVYKDFNANGEVTVFVRSIKDIAGPGSVSATLGGNALYATGNGTSTSQLGTVDAVNLVDDIATVWDETLWASTLSVETDVKDVATPVAADTKVNAGSFKGYVAIYAKGYEGKRLSAKVGKDWVVVPALASNFVRVVEYTGAGYTINVPIYIDRVLVDTITVTTK